MKLPTILFCLMMILTGKTLAQMPPLETGVSQSLAKWRGANYSDVRYKLNITLEKGAPTLKGSIEISVKLSVPPASAGGLKPEIVLDWRKIRGKEDLSTVSNVSVNGQAIKTLADAGGTDLRYEETNEHLVFKDGVKTGENVIKLDFTSPILTSGSAITRYVDKEDGAEYIYSLFVPSDASTAFPVFDQPDLKARFWLDVVVPKDWGVVSNTDIARSSFERDYAEDPREVFLLDHTPTIVVPPGMRLHRFFETKPISTYVFAFAAGEFSKVSVPPASAGGLKSANESRINNNSTTNSATANAAFAPPAHAGGTDKNDLPMKIYVRKSQAEKFKQHSAEVFRLNREGMKFLESYFDYKFPFPKYDLVLIPEFPFGGMEHAGATFLRETSVIFPTEPTKNDYVSRANLIFHEAAHQWFGDTVTMKWFDDLWLKEGFAEFMAYKTLAQVMPEYNAWKIFYERNKQAAYLTDSTKGTTPIYQEIPNLSSAKSAYGNIVYRKAPSFLKQAEFYLGEKEFQTAVRAFLKKHEFANAEWTDLVKEFETASKKDLKDWANVWVKQRGLNKVSSVPVVMLSSIPSRYLMLRQTPLIKSDDKNPICWEQKVKVLVIDKNENRKILDFDTGKVGIEYDEDQNTKNVCWYSKAGYPDEKLKLIFPNYEDYGYGIFLLDEKSRDYVLQNIQNEKDDFLRSMMWGSLWDSVREGELAPADYVELVIKNLNVETDESTIQTLLGRTSTAMNYYIKKDLGFGNADFGLKDKQTVNPKSQIPNPQSNQPSAHADGTDKTADLSRRLEDLLIEKMQNAQTTGQKITFYRAFLNVASSEKARNVLKEMLKRNAVISDGNERERAKTPATQTPDAVKMTAFQLKTKDKFDIVTRLLILGDQDAPQILVDLEKTETSDEAKRYAYAAKAGIGSAENKAKFWNDFVNNKEISESWIEAAFGSFNSSKHSDLTLPYLEKALSELPNLKRNRKIFFVNGWLSSFIGGQKSEAAFAVINKFLADNPNLDKDLRLKILENSDNLERSIKIRRKF